MSAGGPLVLGIDGGGSKTLLALADAGGGIEAAVIGAGINPDGPPVLARGAGGARRPRRRVPAAHRRRRRRPARAWRARRRRCGAGGGDFRLLRRRAAARHQRCRSGALGRLRRRPGRAAARRHRLDGGLGARRRRALAPRRRLRRDDRRRGQRPLDRHRGGGASRAAAIDGRVEAPAFLDGFFGNLGLDRAHPQDALIAWRAAVGHARAEIAALARLVDKLAEAGEPTATALLDQAAGHLALHVAAARRRIGDATLPWSLAGGAFASRILEGKNARRSSARIPSRRCCRRSAAPFTAPRETSTSARGPGMDRAARRLDRQQCSPREEWPDRTAHLTEG